MPANLLGYTAALLFSSLALAGDNFAFKPDPEKPSEFAALEVSAESGKAPLTVKITGPKPVSELKGNVHSKYVNCGFSVQWGDLSSFPARLTQGSSCSGGFEHTYRKPGFYKIIFLITDTNTVTESKVIWRGERIIKVE